MAVATPDDVAVAIGRPISEQAERDQVEYWLGGAEMQIVARLGPVSALDQSAVVYVESEAVASRLTNPDGLQYEAIDDYRYGMPAESRHVLIRDEWWRLLTPRRRARAFSVQPG